MINIDDRLTEEQGAGMQVFWLLYHIARRMNKNSFAFPSNETLCKDTGWSMNTLQRWKSEAVKKGFLRVEKRTSSDGQTSNNYFVQTEYISVFINLKKISTPPTQKLGTPPTQKLGTPPTQKLGNEVLTRLSINPPISPQGDLPQDLGNEYGISANTEIDKLGERLKRLSAESYRDQVIEIVDYFNEVTGKRTEYSTRENLNLIIHHLKDGYTSEDFKQVIDYKTQEFKERPDMARYINLATYCRKDKFEGNLERAKNFSVAAPDFDLNDIELQPDMEERYQRHIDGYVRKFGKISLRPLSKSEFLQLTRFGPVKDIRLYKTQRELPKFFAECMAEIASRPSLQRSYSTVYDFIVDKMRAFVSQKLATR